MQDTENSLRELERHWQIALPPAFGRLYRAFDYPFISPCEFLPLEELREEAERWRGMLPSFLPFGHDGDENFFGFYLPSITAGSDYPVLLWNHEYDHYAPVASGFDAFLRCCVLHGRYEAQDNFDENDPGFAEEERQRREFARLLNLPPELTTGPLPRNERELNERALTADSQNAAALAQLGTAQMARGEVERARDYFARASEATPWFADPYYLLAQTYLLEDKPGPASERLWQVFLCPIALSTRTGGYDLGKGEEDVEVYEAAADRFRQCPQTPAVLADSPLGRLLRYGDPFESQARLRLAETLEIAGDGWGVERELLNALTLATSEMDGDAAYARLIAFYTRINRTRDAALCRRDSGQD